MLNYPVGREVLEPFVPAGTTLDTYKGKAYVSVVGFLFRKTRLLGVPVPFHQDFEEVNLRFYVRRFAGDDCECPSWNSFGNRRLAGKLRSPQSRRDVMFIVNRRQ